MKSFQIYKKSGYLLVEVLVAIVIVGFFFALAVPVIEEENAKRELFISAQTLTHAIRSAQIDAKSDIYQIEDVSHRSRKQAGTSKGLSFGQNHVNRKNKSSLR